MLCIVWNLVLTLGEREHHCRVHFPIQILSSPWDSRGNWGSEARSTLQPIERQPRLKPGQLETRVVRRAGAHKVPGAGTKASSPTG